MINAGKHGALTWVDLSTPDVKAAASFYAKLFGWEIESSETPMGEYHIGKVGDRQVAGMMEQGPELRGQPAVWTVFLYSDDLDETVAAVPLAGGTVLEEPFDISGGAQIAVVADPSGAMFGVFAGPEIEGVYYGREHGMVCWADLLSRDPDAAEPFYADVFGWKPEVSIGHGTTYTMFKLDGEDVGGMLLMPPEVPAKAPSHWATYFAVADCRASESKAADMGGQVLRTTTDIEIGKFAVIEDPQGAPFHLMEIVG